MATYWENSCSFGLRYVSWYEYLIVSLVFSHLGFWSGNLFLIAPFPDLCLLVPFANTSDIFVEHLTEIYSVYLFSYFLNKGYRHILDICRYNSIQLQRYTWVIQKVNLIIILCLNILLKFDFFVS